LTRRPSAVDALEILQRVEWRRGDIQAYLEVTAALCQLHLRAQNTEAAWSDFEAYRNAGGDKLRAGVWLDIARMLETQQNFEPAATEYEQLAEVHPKEKQSVLALLGATRLHLKRLNRPEDALRNYRAAAASSAPHLDWDPNIQAGITEAERALAKGCCKTQSPTR
jgi:tetratricopeptide (TPR) repeat protein